jgi:hypothetical protein
MAFSAEWFTSDSYVHSWMEPFTSRLLLIALVTALSSSFLVTLISSPLNKISAAHWSVPFSSLWIRSHRRGGSQAIEAIAAAHARKGPIVRLGLNEISVSSLEGAKKVYVERGGFAKPKWWTDQFITYGVRNMVSMAGGYENKEHALRKRDIGNVYAKSFLMGNDQLIGAAKTILPNLKQILDDVIQESTSSMDKKGKGVLEVYNFNGAVNADFASYYIFGQTGNTGFLRNPSERDAYYAKHDTWLRGKPGHERAQEQLEDFGFSQCRLAESALNFDSNNAPVYKQLSLRGVSGKDLTSEVMDHFIAGAEAPRTTLTYLEWELSKDATLQARLREELRTLPQQDGNLDFRALDSLPLLDAILTETLRVYTPTPGPQHRITPPEGTTIHDSFIPGGTQISVSLSLLHRNSDVFPDAARWNPDRWLIKDQAKIEEMRKWFWAFSKGSRICIGKDFTLIGELPISFLAYL